MDMNMAKVMLEERVKDLTTQLQEAQETNFQMDQKIKDLQTNPNPLQPKQSLSAKDNFDTIPNPSSKITELEAVNSKLQKEINTLQTQLMQAQQNKSLPEEEGKMSETHTNSVDLSLTDPAIAIVDLQKQLKLSKQEAMQLRFRSNNLERVHEKLEETLKENKALEVKLTTLEGQLFEQRHRTISQSQSQNLENGFELDEKTKELNQKTAQLIVCERELEFVKKELDEIKKRDPSNQLIVAVSNSNGQEEFLVQNLNDKLMSLQEKLVQLTQENQDQAKKIEVFYTNLQQTNQEKIDLQRIMDQMVNESQQLEQIIQQERQQYLQAMCIMENSSHHNEKMPSPTATFTNALTPPIKTSRVSELMKIFK
jgi:chromosome segregation ATPase